MWFVLGAGRDGQSLKVWVIVSCCTHAAGAGWEGLRQQCVLLLLMGV
jgi:hypothetical protein